MEIGLARHEKCLCIAGEDKIEGILRQMVRTGINAEHAMDTGALSVTGNRDTYLRQGRFDPDRMIRDIQKAAEDARSDGFSALRVIGDMSWALGTYPGVERLIEYETRVDSLFADSNILAVCHYDGARFNPVLISRMFDIHPCCWL